MKNKNLNSKILTTLNLSVGYGKKTVVSSINQEFKKGQFVCLLGPNGSGKTTILRTLARLLNPINGAVYLKGKNIQDFTPSEIAKNLSVVLTGHLSPGLITVFEFVAMGRYPYTGFMGRLSKEDIKKVEDSLKLVHGYHLRDRYFNELSDGERQKVVFARALAQEPDVIILDEPTIHLDLKHRIELIGVLRESCKKKGITVIVSLHDIDLALKIADIVILVKNGKIMDFGEPDEVLDEETVLKLYDLNSARFNKELGTIDIIGSGNSKKESVFVIGGGGKGASIYRHLVKKDITLFSGVIHENDVDFFVASSLGITVISEKPFTNISQDSIKRSLEFLEKSHIVVDSGFPIGEANIKNVELLNSALSRGKKVFSLRKKDELFSLLKDKAKEVVICEKIHEILV